MHGEEFEHAFSEFLDSPQCDEAEEKLFVILRMAFAADWQAARDPRPIRLDDYRG